MVRWKKVHWRVEARQVTWKRNLYYERRYIEGRRMVKWAKGSMA